MVMAKSYLASLPNHSLNSDFINISNKIDEYLKKYCCHNIVTDSIDVDYESSQNIKYCEHCYQSFS